MPPWPKPRPSFTICSSVTPEAAVASAVAELRALAPHRRQGDPHRRDRPRTRIEEIVLDAEKLTEKHPTTCVGVLSAIWPVLSPQLCAAFEHDLLGELPVLYFFVAGWEDDGRGHLVRGTCRIEDRGSTYSARAEAEVVGSTAEPTVVILHQPLDVQVPNPVDDVSFASAGGRRRTATTPAGPSGSRRRTACYSTHYEPGGFLPP